MKKKKAGNMFSGSRVKGERRRFASVPFHRGLDMSGLACCLSQVEVELSWAELRCELWVRSRPISCLQLFLCFEKILQKVLAFLTQLKPVTAAGFCRIKSGCDTFSLRFPEDKSYLTFDSFQFLIEPHSGLSLLSTPANGSFLQNSSRDWCSVHYHPSQ